MDATEVLYRKFAVNVFEKYEQIGNCIYIVAKKPEDHVMHFPNKN